jgi:hypothetical protein
VGDIKTLKKLECPYNDTTNGKLSTLISFEVSVQELIDLVKLLLKCSTYFAQGLIEMSIMRYQSRWNEKLVLS